MVAYNALYHDVQMFGWATAASGGVHYEFEMFGQSWSRVHSNGRIFDISVYNKFVMVEW